ncbi:MAG: hypothetical protein WKF49_05040, partial [Thermoleophilaceae bacterium]
MAKPQEAAPSGGSPAANDSFPLDPRADEQTITIYERSRAGRRAFVAPACDVPEVPVSDLLPDWARRTEEAGLPEVSEPEIVRHFNGLSKKNF